MIGANIRLAVADGEPQTLVMSRGDLGDDLAPGCRVAALFWRGRAALLIRGRHRADTCASPDARLTDARGGAAVCTFFGLLLTVPLVFGTANGLRRLFWPTA